MEVQVWYTVPVACHVNTQTGEVSRVVAIDEMVKYDPNEGVTFEDYGGKVEDDVAEAALKVAESKPWPPWEHGY
jgi:hypothetical protein